MFWNIVKNSMTCAGTIKRCNILVTKIQASCYKFNDLIKIKKRASLNQGLIKAVFNIDIPILGTQIWACPNLILIKNKNDQ